MLKWVVLLPMITKRCRELRNVADTKTRPKVAMTQSKATKTVPKKRNGRRKRRLKTTR